MLTFSALSLDVVTQRRSGIRRLRAWSTKHPAVMLQVFAGANRDADAGALNG